MLDESIDRAESVIRKWEILDGVRNFSTMLYNDREEAKRFLEAATSLHHAMLRYVKMSTKSEKLIRAHKLMQIAMKRLQIEFYIILSASKRNFDTESFSGGVSESDGDRFEENTAVMDLKSIADCMIGCGYGKECVDIYRIIRKSIVDETIYSLGVERLDLNRMKKMEWKVLETMIRRWLYAAQIAVKTLFAGEKTLCEIVFSSSEKIAELCFTEISRDAAKNLFVFPENVARCRKILSPEKIFRLLDLYEAISDLWPEIEFTFSNELLTAVRSQAVAALLKLGDAVRTMLAEFEVAIRKDSSKPPPDGGVHPLTRYVMNFLVFLGDYSGAVSDIVEDWPMKAPNSPPEFHFSSPSSGGEADSPAAEISVRLRWLILILLCKLDGKAALYNDVALSYLFLVNNLNYVVSKVGNSNLRLLIGEDFIWKHELKVEKYLANYERIGWGEVTSALPENPSSVIPPPEVFDTFYTRFQEAYRRQSSWVIPDKKLRERVKVSLADKIVSGYRVFYQKHRAGFGLESIARCAPEDLDNYLSDPDLFFAAGGNNDASSFTTSYVSSRGR